MEPIYIPMFHVKDTKGTHVYQRVDEEGAVRSLYINKGELPTPLPSHIIITIEVPRSKCWTNPQ